MTILPTGRPSRAVAQTLARSLRACGAGVGAVTAALAIGAVLITLWGVSPLRAYGALAAGAFGSQNGIAETLLRSIPLTLAGLGICIAFRANCFNIGAEGQLYVGGTAAAWVGIAVTGLPGPLLDALMLAAAVAAGAAWSAVAGGLKLRYGASELITTIMLSYVAIDLVSYLLHGPMQDPASYLAQSAALPRAAALPVLLPRTRLHAGLLIALAATLATHLALWHTVWGFRLRVVGHNGRAATNAGMGVGRSTLGAFLVSGGLAGLAGFTEVVGVQHKMIEGLSPGYGYTAIVVALLGGISPFGVLAAAIVFAALQVGATTMESAAGVPGTLCTVIQGLVVLFLIGRGAGSLVRRPAPREIA